MKILEIIEELKNTPSLNDKRMLLRNQIENELFKRVLEKTFDPRITFGIKKIPVYRSGNQFLLLDNALDELERLEKRELTGKNAIAFLKGVLESVHPDDAKIIEWVIRKDFKAGFGVSLINDEMKPFQIYSVPYMGAVSFNEKKVKNLFGKYPYAYSEVKMDGRYLNIIVDDSVFLESRGGKPNPLMGALEDDAMKFRNKIASPVSINGELMFSGESNRYKANGIISSYVSISQKYHDGLDITKESIKFEKENGITIEEAKQRIKLVVWDFIPLKDFYKGQSSVSRSERLSKLEETIKGLESFEIIEYKIVNNYSEAVEHFQEMIQRGDEGTILKGSYSPWKKGKPVFQIKMKLEMNLDLRVIGYNFGTKDTKNENVISSLNCESSCGLLRTSPGGIKEKMMDELTETKDELFGSIIEIKCSGLSQDSNGDWSCLHPVFLKIRDDKQEANSLEECIEIEEMKKGLNIE